MCSRALDVMKEVSARKWNDSMVAETEARVVALKKAVQSARSIMWENVKKTLDEVGAATSSNKKRAESFKVPSPACRRAFVTPLLTVCRG